MNKNIKIISIIFILIISYIIINLIFGNQAFAVNQTTSTDINSIDSNKYPQVKETIQKLKNQHPNWNFKILYTDIAWSDVIANEYVGHGSSPRNLVPANNANYDGGWICKACGSKSYDNGKWNCASEAAIAYMIDPRNSANYTDIFQFMQLSYVDCNRQTVKAMVYETFLNNDSYINAIIEAAKQYDVNPYYIVARILQEQGKGGSTLSAGKGYNGQYVGYYNVFNIGANGNGKDTVILNGLKRAQTEGWTTLESSIFGGTKIIAQSYIKRGQDTLYFQKFDVENSDGNLYWHQYMQNILAAQKEGQTLRRTFESVNSVDAPYTFIIPVYKNMPSSAAPRPSTTSSGDIPTNTELVRVNVTGTLYLRSEPKKSSSQIGKVYKDEIITRLSMATNKVDGTYWDYVMKADGTKGYAARQTYDSEATYKLYLVPVENQTPGQPDGGGDSSTIIKNDKVKIDMTTNDVATVPGATVKDFADFIGKDVVVKNASGELLGKDAKLGTGCTIDGTYHISVLGDVNGDGKISSSDYVRIKNYMLNKITVNNEQKVAADANNDGKISSSDYVRIKNYMLNKANISI